MDHVALDDAQLEVVEKCQLHAVPPTGCRGVMVEQFCGDRKPLSRRPHDRERRWDPMPPMMAEHGFAGNANRLVSALCYSDRFIPLTMERCGRRREGAKLFWPNWLTGMIASAGTSKRRAATRIASAFGAS